MSDPLAAWKHARDRAGSRLVQVICEGDSTFAGQVLVDGDPFYSPVTRIRERLHDAGVLDGGHGVMNGLLDTPDVSGEPADAGVLAEPAYETNNGQCLQGNYTGSTTTVGATYEAAIYGTRVRVSLARYAAASTVDVTIDGATTRLTVPPMTTTPGTQDGNWQAAHWHYAPDLVTGRHLVTVELVTGRLSCLVEGTRDRGVVLHNFASRARRAIDTPWHQMQDWAGLTVSSAPPVVPAALDDRPGSHASALGIFAKGINDQQSAGGTDTSAAYGAKAFDFARAFIARGASAIICSPWWESAGQPQLASAYRAAAAQAAADSGALFLDLGPAGALAEHSGEAIGGGGGNPHLTALGYRYQGDHIAEALLEGYDPAGLVVAGRQVIGARLAGQGRQVIEVRGPRV